MKLKTSQLTRDKLAHGNLIFSLEYFSKPRCQTVQNLSTLHNNPQISNAQLFDQTFVDFVTDQVK